MFWNTCIGFATDCLHSFFYSISLFSFICLVAYQSITAITKFSKISEHCSSAPIHTGNRCFQTLMFKVMNSTGLFTTKKCTCIASSNFEQSIANIKCNHTVAKHNINSITIYTMDTRYRSRRSMFLIWRNFLDSLMQLSINDTLPNQSGGCSPNLPFIKMHSATIMN